MKEKILKGFKKIVIGGVISLLFLGFIGLNDALAGVKITLDGCRDAAKGNLSRYPQWAQGELGPVTVYYDLKNNPSAYVFGVVKDGKTLGYMAMNARQDYFPIIEYAIGPNLPSNMVDRCREIASNVTSGKLGSPKFLYLGGIDYLVSFPVEGPEESITVGLRSGMIYTKENLARMQTMLESRTKEQKSQAEKSWGRAFSKAPQPLSVAEKYLSGVEEYTWYRGCGPSSAGMLLNYYGTNTSPLGYYPNLYCPPATFTWSFPGTQTTIPFCPRKLVDEIANNCGLRYSGGTTTNYGVSGGGLASAIDADGKKYGYPFQSSFISLGLGQPSQYYDRFKAEINVNRPFILGFGVDNPGTYSNHWTFAYGYKYENDSIHYIRIYNTWGWGYQDVVLENQNEISAVFSTPPPIDTQPDEITVYHRYAPDTRELSYTESVFKQGATVYVTVTDGTTTGLSVVTSPIVVVKANKTGTITAPLEVRDDGTGIDQRAYDGIYTGQFSLSQFSPELGNGEQAIITANLNNGTIPGSFTITAEYIPPAFIESPTVSKSIFSPLLPSGTTTVLFTARDDLANGSWTYTITIDNGIIPFGTGSTGTCKGSTAVRFDWNGKDTSGNLLADGTHIIKVDISDLAENFNGTTTQVIIDTTDPVITNAGLSDDCFSPPAPEGTTTITFTGSDTNGTWSYILLVGTRTLCGSGLPTGTRTTPGTVTFDWNGKVQTGGGELLLGEGIHLITILLTDFVGNTVSTTLFARIDKTNPWSSAISTSRYIFSPQGIYPTTTISFTAGDVDSSWGYAILVDGQTPGGVGEPTGTRTAGTSSISFIWNGSPLDKGTYTVLVTITDFAGNAVNTATTVIIDTTKPILDGPYASSYCFSPLQSTVTITFTGNDERGTWSYELKVDGSTPGGVGTPADTCVGSKTITFVWDVSTLIEGTHTVSVTLTDFAGNTNINTREIYKDATPPTIGSLTVSDYYISHIGDDKTTVISFYGNDDRNTWRYNLNVGTRSLGGDIPYGTKTGATKVEFTWNGKDNQGTPFNEGENVVNVTLTDLAGNTKTQSISIFIDNTPPQLSTLTSTSYYFSPAFGRGTPTLISTTKDNYGNWYYEFRISGEIPAGTPPATGTSEFKEKIIAFTWNGLDINGNSYWQGNHVVILTVKDAAGNVSTRTTTIAIDNTPPGFVEEVKVAPTSFSYKGTPATITFTAKDNETATWTYKITITEKGVEKKPAGTGIAGGIIGGQQTVTFLWDGYYMENGNKFPCSDGNHQVNVTITDLAGNSTIGSATVEMESTSPTIISYQITRSIFSPPADDPYNYTAITFKANDNKNTWKYHLSIIGTTSTPLIVTLDLQPDTFTTDGTKTVNFIWNGYVDGGTLLPDGTYFLTITVYDKMNNTDYVMLPITIDTKLPVITEVTDDTYGTVRYQGEQISFALKADESGAGTILLGTTSLQSAEEVITGDQKISLNAGFGQFEPGVAGGKIEIFTMKGDGTEIKSHEFTIEYYTKLSDLINDINSAISGIGTMSYSESADRFTISCLSNYRIALREYDVETYKVGFFTAIKLPSGYVNLSPVLDEYRGYYKIPKMAEASAFDVFGRFRDTAGNWAANNGTYTGSILLNGSQPVPVGNSKIVGIKIDPPGMTFNTHKTQLTLSMVVAEVKQELENPIIKYGTDSAVIYHPNIKKDMQVIIWSDYIRDTKNNIINDHARVWKVTANQDGTITISNNSLYFGNSIGTYSSPALSENNIQAIVGTFTTSGMASIDVGILQSGVKLYDDGDINYHRDKVADDGIYTGIYNVPNNIETKDVPIIGHYTGPNSERVSNDGYPFNDEENLPFSYPEYDTVPNNNISISFDTIRPQIIIIGASTPFNPYKDSKAEIKYRLEKSIAATVKVVIKKGDKVIKDLGFQDAVSGDNVLYWDGKDELSNIVDDGTYRFYIEAQDEAGNSTEDVIFGSIKVTSVDVKIDELIVVPSKPILKGDKLVLDHLTVKIKAKIEASKPQLENLDFAFIPYSKDIKYDTWLYDKPYAIFYITLHDAQGKIIDGPDNDWSYLEGGVDTDPHLTSFDLPNYYIRPEDRDPAGDPNTILQHYPLPDPPGKPLSEFGDGDKFNDWDTLKPFNRDKLENIDDKNYTAEFNGSIVGLEVTQGTYYISVFAQLVGPWWNFVDHKKDEAGNIIGEMWHYKPDYFHYGLISSSREQRFAVIKEDYPETDHTPPDIYESSPASGQTISPGEIKSGEENMTEVVWVRVKDSETGVNFEKSGIELRDSKNRLVDGQPKHNGIDKLYWILNKEKFPQGLIRPGEYSIHIRVLDKAANEKTDVYTFRVEDRVPPQIVDYSPKENSIYSEFDKIIITTTLSEEDTGESEINWDTSKIRLLYGTKEINIGLPTITEINKNYGIMKYTVSGLAQGTYTMEIIAWDKSTTPGPNSSVKNVTFFVATLDYIQVRLGTLTYLFIPPDTRATATTGGSSTIVSTYTITMATTTSTPPAHSGFYTLGQTVYFLFGGTPERIKFNKEVQLVMYYTDNDIAELNKIPLTEDVLKLYGATTNKWIYEANATPPENNRIMLSIPRDTELKNKYAIMYPRVVASLSADRKSFSPFISTLKLNFKSDQDGTYTLVIDTDKIPGGIGTPTGNITAEKEVTFIWNGKDALGNLFKDGTHTVTLKVRTIGGGYSEISIEIMIDTSSPEITVLASDYYFSPGASISIKDTTSIEIKTNEPMSYIIKVTNSHGGSLTTIHQGTLTTGYSDIFTWDGSPFGSDEGTHTMIITATDLAGNAATKSLTIIIDSTSPTITSFTNDAPDVIRYSGDVVALTMEVNDNVIGGSGTAVLAGAVTGTITLNYERGVYKGFYTVGTNVFGTVTLIGGFVDKAGNTATPKLGMSFFVNGSRTSEAKYTRIVRLYALPPVKEDIQFTIGSPTLSSLEIKSAKIYSGDKLKVTKGTYTWVATADTAGMLTISNANLCYGTPINDYTKLGNLDKVEILKKVCKLGDEVELTITGVWLSKKLIPGTLTASITSLQMQCPEIMPGERIIVYDDTHTWISKAVIAGSMTISNSNLYAGSIISDYSKLSHDRLTIARGEFAAGGSGVASIDLGTIYPGITIYYQGNGVYTGIISTKERMDTENAPIYGHFTYTGIKAENDTYPFNDTDTSNDQRLNIDATPPFITIYGASPSTFSPIVQNTTIKYNLLEAAIVEMGIYKDVYNTPANPDDDVLIRRLTPPAPNFGDNCQTVWDGKDDRGNPVVDGEYSFHIDAVDYAGNQAVQRRGIIRVVNVNIYCKDIMVHPTPFTPNPAMKDRIDTNISLLFGLDISKEQLIELGFSPEYSNDPRTLPWALVTLEFYDKNANRLFPTVLTKGTGIDLFPNGLPVYEGVTVPTPEFGKPDLPDEGYGNSYIVPFHLVNGEYLGGIWDNNLKRVEPIKFMVRNWNIPNGVYFVRTYITLVSTDWRFVTYRISTGNYIIGDVYEQLPLDRGNIISQSVEGRIEVVSSPISTPDNLAPVIVAISPAPGTTREPGQVTEVSATLEDIGGAGVYLNGSTIYLKDVDGLLVNGYQTNDGEKTIYWKIVGKERNPEALTSPGEYTIYIRAVDNSNNGAEAGLSTYKFTVRDTLAPIVLSTIPQNGEEKPPYSVDRIEVVVSEYTTGKAGIDWQKSSVSLFRDEINLIGGKLEPSPIDGNRGSLIYILASPLDEIGTYTIKIELWDKVGNKSDIGDIKFVISDRGYTRVMLDSKVTLSIHPEIQINHLPIGSVTITVGTESLPATGSLHPQFTPLAPIIFFTCKQPQGTATTIEFTQIPVKIKVKLIMYYKEADIPIGVTEQQLAIFGYTSGKGWETLGGLVDEAGNKILLDIPEGTTLKEKYVIMAPILPSIRVWYNNKLYLEIPAGTYINVKTLSLENMITIEEVSDVPAQHPNLTVTPPIIRFLLQQKADPISFNMDTKLTMYSENTDIPVNVDKKSLKIYGGDKDGNWRRIEGTVTEGLGTVTLISIIVPKNSTLYDKYAIMYPSVGTAVIPGKSLTNVYCYPNPAKDGKITFSYDLANSSRVTIKVYSLMGDLVWENEYNDSQPGRAEHTWGCINKAGKRIASGLYIYRITANDNTQEVTVTKKLIVVQ